MTQLNDVTQTHDYLLNKCDEINQSYTNIKGMYARMDSTLTKMTSTLNQIDELVTRFNKKDEGGAENRPACIPGFYNTTKYTPVPPQVPSPKNILAAGTAQNAVRAIRNNHYR